ncbi:MAG: PLDc_N domain-containing protein [Anaerolineaceae bacterium]|nr:PLDc_N domain-containing protein [Anaerolineaceae bacterium]
MEFITNNLPLLIPIFIIQLALIVFALADLARRENTRGPKWVWVLVILFINMIGPIVYFLVGRDEA